jgi:hypothetical protein
MIDVAKGIARRGITVTLLFLSVMYTPLWAAEQPIEALLPPQGCAKGWTMEGKVQRYTAENLYSYINGEAELYMPFGFETLGTVLYVKTGSTDTALAADVYRMGSLLDAFGIYSYYRNPDGDDARVGADGFADESQVMFYKDRYFVRISASGAGNPEREAFDACAKSIAGMISGGSSRPAELEIFKVPDIVPKTEQYIAQSVMGYAFFRKGLTADATLDGRPVKVFVVIDTSEQASINTFEGYLKYLKDKGIKPEMIKSGQGVTLLAMDPLYKGVVVRQAGRYVFGTAGLADPKKGAPMIERLQPRIDSANSVR